MRLDAVPVGVDHEGRVIVGAVVAAQARRSVIAPTVAKRGLMELVHAAARRCRKGDMQARLFVGRNGVLRGTDPERGSSLSIAEGALDLDQAYIAERFERRVVEAFRGGDVADTDRNVIDHGFCSLLVGRCCGMSGSCPARLKGPSGKRRRGLQTVPDSAGSPPRPATA